MEERYFTLKLTLSELPDGRYRSRIESSPIGASKGSGHDFDVRMEEIKNWVSQAPGGKAPTRDALREQGRLLFDRVFKNGVKEKYEACVVAARQRKARLRIGISLLAPALIAAPWEYLHDDASFLLKNGQLIVRVIDTLDEKLAYFRPIRQLLVVGANPTSDAQYTSFDADAHIARLLKHVKSDASLSPLRNPSKQELANALRDGKPDALYFIGHGRYRETLEGQLVLAKGDGTPDYLDADNFASMVRESGGVRFVYLNSCSTATTGMTNIFSGVAQRLMLDGGVQAVVGMQVPVGQTSAFNIAERFFNELSRGSSPELALARARSAPDDFHSWGIPVVYTYLGGANDFERNRIACLLGAEIGVSRYGIVLPSFGMGVPLDGLGDMTAPKPGTYRLPADPTAITVRVHPTGTYVFPGDTHAREDVEAAADLVGLLMLIARPNQIALYESPENRPGVTHWFLFGSRSNEIVANLLHEYSPRYRFRYTQDEWHLDWLNAAREPCRSQCIRAPHGLGRRAYAKTDDLGIIEKITANDGRVFFILAGLGSRATRGCGLYFARHWNDIVKEFGGDDFGVALRFPGGLSADHAERIEAAP